MSTIPAVFELRRDPAIGGWLVYHPECGYIGRLKRKSAGGCRRLLWAARSASRSRGYSSSGDECLEFFEDREALR